MTDELQRIWKELVMMHLR